MKLILISGAGSGKAGWANQLGEFPDAEAVPLPGHPAGKPLTSIERYADWLHGRIIAKQYRDFVLAGHSMGGAVAQFYALKYGASLRGLILIGSGARLRVLPDRLSTLARILNDMAGWRNFLAGEYAHLEPGIRRVLMDEGAAIGPGVALNDYRCCDSFDIMGRLGEINLPALLICGTADDRTPLKYTGYLAENINGAQVLAIEGASHWAHIDHPVEVNQAIRTFLARLG